MAASPEAATDRILSRFSIPSIFTRPAASHLKAMADSANAGHLIPEQVWDRANQYGFTFGGATGSAAPLAWAEAQFVRLAQSIDAGRPVDRPAVVAARYGIPGA